MCNIFSQTERILRVRTQWWGMHFWKVLAEHYRCLSSSMELPLLIYIYFGFAEEGWFNQLQFAGFCFHPLNSVHMANQSVLLIYYSHFQKQWNLQQLLFTALHWDTIWSLIIGRIVIKGQMLIFSTGFLSDVLQVTTALFLLFLFFFF